MRRLLWGLIIAVLPGTAGTLPRLSLNQLLDASSAVVHGRVTRHWSAWDADQQFIWTHYELRASEVLQGRNASTFTISEPGGVVGDLGLKFSNAVPFADGEEVIVFLEKVPNGYLRVTGGVQGKLRVFDTATGKQVRAEAHVFPGSSMDRFVDTFRSTKSRREVKR